MCLKKTFTTPASAMLLFSSSVVFDSLRPGGLQHARLPCPSLSPTVCIYHILFIHSSIPGYLGCFHFVAVVNSAAVSVDG